MPPAERGPRPTNTTPDGREIATLRSITEQGHDLLWQQRAATPLGTLVNELGGPLLPSEEKFLVQLPDPLVSPEAFVDAIDQLKPGYDHTSRKIAVPEEDLKLGHAIARIYAKELTRQVPWLIKDDRISLGGRTLARTIKEVGMKTFFVPKEGEIDILIDKALTEESITQSFARLLELFDYVELQINNFMARGTNLYEFYLGLSDSFPQWGREEGQHARGIRKILQFANVKETGKPHKTPEELRVDRENVVSNTWEQPFPTARQMVIYAYLQEKQTNLQYENLVQRAMKESAPMAALVLSLIKHDEAYHHGGYRRYVEEFLKHDTIGTIRDLFYVALNYEMPSVKLLGRAALVALARSGVFTPELLVKGTLQDSIKVLKFPDKVTSKDPEQDGKPIPPKFNEKIAYLSAKKYAEKHNYHIELVA